MDKSVGNNKVQTRPMGGNTATTVIIKPTKAEAKKALTVEEELELAKKEAERNQKLIAQLEAEKKIRDDEAANRLAREQTEAEERKQFEVFKSLMSTVKGQNTATVVVSSPVVETTVEKSESVSTDKKAEPSGLFGENTSYLIRVMGGTVVVLVVLYLAILALFGKSNDSVNLMTDSFPMRMYINLLIVVVAIGVGFIGMRLLFTEQYKYVHSKINSLCSPRQDWERSSPEFRLRFASEQLWRFAFLFVLALMVIFT